MRLWPAVSGSFDIFFFLFSNLPLGWRDSFVVVCRRADRRHRAAPARSVLRGARGAIGAIRSRLVDEQDVVGKRAWAKGHWISTGKSASAA